MMVAGSCTHCLGRVKSKRREFTDQAWTVLFAWGEVAEDTVDTPICDDCYVELRDILIDRAVEVETALNNPDALRKMVEAAKNPKPVIAQKKQAAVANIQKKIPTPVTNIKDKETKSNSNKAQDKKEKAPAKVIEAKKAAKSVSKSKSKTVSKPVAKKGKRQARMAG